MPMTLRLTDAESEALGGNHALVDGNKRLALAATIAFLGVNGRRLTFSNDQAYDLIVAAAGGELEDVATIARRIAAFTRPR